MSDTIGRRRRAVLIAGFCFAITLSLPGCRESSLPPGTVPDTTPPAVTPERKALTADELQQAVQLRDLALGYLENEDAPQAAELLEKLRGIVPLEVLVARNLAVARLIALEQADPNRDPAAVQAAKVAARSAVKELREREPAAASTDLLESRVLKLTGEQEASVAVLQAATTRPGADVAVWYEYFSAIKLGTDPAVKDTARKALQAAKALQPENLFLLPELAQWQAEAQDPAVGETLDQLAQLLEPFAETIQTHTRVNPVQLARAAQEAVEAKNWNLVLRNTRVIGNILRPEAISQSDRLRLLKHPLEFVLPEFSDSLKEQVVAASSGELSEVPAPVKFAQQPETLVSPEALSTAGLPDQPENTTFVVADVSLDGRPEFLITRGARLSCWTQTTPTSGWSLVNQLALPGLASSLLLADLDDDVDLTLGEPVLPERCHEADLDALVYGPLGVRVLENRREGEMRQWLLRDTPPEWSERPVLSATMADLDHDGDCDVCFGTSRGLSLWVNRGNWSFEQISARSLLPETPLEARAMTVCDWDRDTDLDVLVATTGQGVGVLENLRYGRFRWQALPAEWGLTGPVDRLQVLEIDGNVSWDLLYAGPTAAGIVTTRTVAGSFPTLMAVQSLPLPEYSSGLRSSSSEGNTLLTGDLNLDGWLDGVATGVNSTFWTGSRMGWQVQSSAAVSVGSLPAADRLTDIDADGDLDLVSLSGAGLLVRRNLAVQETIPPHWLELSLRAQQVKGAEQAASGRVNHYGLGSLVEVRAGGRYQAAVVDGPVMHFGLGASPQAEVVRVLWTNGVPRNVIQPAANELICERQTLKGSCPYLYTWNGARFEFCTDLLWAAPLGLKFAENVIAPWREWEYLKISGEQLVPRDGRYVIQITEELWEAAYFDQVELLAVDHPADTEMLTNEKVGPAELAAHRLHFVTQRIAPVAALNWQGDSVLPQVVTEDAVYATTYERKLRQGLTTPHHLELEFPPFGSGVPVTLFLRGWLYPTDTSINVALSQNPELPEISPLALLVPTAAGAGAATGSESWQVARPFTGFPGGKPKTIALDVTGVLDPARPRLRLACNQELYFDVAFLSVGDPQPPHEVRPLAMLRADLHGRGVSRIEMHPTNGPEWYDYTRVRATSPWPPMEGALTPLGGVQPALSEWDDQLVVIGAGDEMTLEFESPPPPRAGWRRDFVLHNVGWDKDADMNTVYGHGVEPLPFRAMQVYGDSPEMAARESPQSIPRTRLQSRVRFWRELASPQVRIDADTTAMPTSAAKTAN